MNPSVEHAIPTFRAPRQLTRLPIPATARQVVKRTGEAVRFDLNKIARAIALAVYEVKHSDAKNPYRDDFLACFGLDPDDFIAVTKTAERVQTALEGLFYRTGKHPSIEQIQNAIVSRSPPTAGGTSRPPTWPTG